MTLIGIFTSSNPLKLSPLIEKVEEDDNEYDMMMMMMMMMMMIDDDDDPYILGSHVILYIS